MKLPFKQKLKKIAGISCLFLSLSSNLFAQAINYRIFGNDIEDKSNLKVRSYVSFCIPPSDLVEGLPVIFNLEAQYWTPKIDYRATASFGTFKGATIGMTYHKFSGIKTKNDKFVISVSKNKNTETTTYFRAPVKVYKISGPCVDLTTGAYAEAGFYSKLDFGWDFQTYGRAYAEYEKRTLKGSRNGWMSVKVQGVLANVAIDMTDYFKLGAGTGKYTEERKTAIGAQVHFGLAARPWKGVCFYWSMPLGYMKYMGVDNAPSTSNKGAPIFNINLGVQVRL